MGRSCVDSLVPKHTEADIEQERRREEEEVEDGDGDLCMNDRWQMELSGFPHFARPDTFGHDGIILKVGTFSQISSLQHHRHQKILTNELGMGRTGAN